MNEVEIIYVVSTSLFGSDARADIGDRYAYGGGTTPLESLLDAIKCMMDDEGTG